MTVNKNGHCLIGTTTDLMNNGGAVLTVRSTGSVNGEWRGRIVAIPMYLTWENIIQQEQRWHG